MSTQQTDLAYFTQRLRELLYTSFPELSGDSAFIEHRAQLALSTYESALRAGNRMEQCQAIADCVLFEGLYFSKFDMLFKIVSHEFDTLMADEELQPFTLKMLPVCRPVFNRYDLTDDFAYSSGYDLLYNELTDTIATWIAENGLQ